MSPIARGLFRRHEVRCAQSNPMLRQLIASIGQTCEAEVQEPHVAGVGYEHVRRLDVAMNDPLPVASVEHIEEAFYGV